MTQEFPWLDTVQGAAAVDVAARCGLLAKLEKGDASSACPALLETLLTAAGVTQREGQALVFTTDFSAAWQSDSTAIMARASFFRTAAADIAAGLDALVFDLPDFMQNSATFRLFRYDMAEGTTLDHLNATRPWENYVEALSKSESPHLVPLMDVRDGDRILEIGGNTGLMSEALIKTYTGVTSRILDLPAVCALGRERTDLAGLEFIAGDARKLGALAPFAGSVDVVLFKSVLHDWPEKDAAEMLARAIEILPSGGRIIVCERGAFGTYDAAGKIAFSLANMVFSPFYRNQSFYRDIMLEHGLTVAEKSVKLDMMFYATTGTRA